MIVILMMAVSSCVFITFIFYLVSFCLCCVFACRSGAMAVSSGILAAHPPHIRVRVSCGNCSQPHEVGSLGLALLLMRVASVKSTHLMMRAVLSSHECRLEAMHVVPYM